MKAGPNELQRYDDRERLYHWLTVVLLMVALVSGMALFHPSLYFLSAFTGGGAWSRILHPFIGVATVVVFLFLYLRVRIDNQMTAQDKAWRAKMGELLRGRKENMPEAGKYNAAQKMVFWAMSISLVVLIVTGFAMWRPYFAHLLPIDAVRVAVVLHAISAVVMVLSIILHVYAVIWVQGTLRAMTRGTVTRAWARRNHAAWHREMTQGK
jgi:formate dehydrogenase subunit gamma